MSNSYWNSSGKYQVAADQLHNLIPGEGAVPNPRKNAALERFRNAVNCYYDLYNNGLCNRRTQFTRVFGINTSRYKIGFGSHRLEMYNRVEEAMDAIVLAAANEQNVCFEQQLELEF